MSLGAWRIEARDFVELFAAPVLIALLPAGIGWWVARRLCARDWLYRHETESAWVAATSAMPARDATTWRLRHRLTRLYDHADLYLWLWRRRAWFAKRVVVEGAWPAEGPFMAVTYHWGRGLWGLHSLRLATGGFAGVAASPQRHDYDGRWVLYRHVVLRTRATAEIIGGGLSFTGSAAGHLLRALKAGKATCGLYDVPAHAGEKTLPGTLLDRRVAMPRGFPYISAHNKVPLVTFACTLDFDSGLTRLVIDPPRSFDDPEEANRYLLGRLDALIDQEPAIWHHWGALPQFAAAINFSSANRDG